jgi:two-component system, chemotaxis family, chemotaxis protein CheY
MNSEMKILIIDDFSTVRKLIKGHLKQFGYVNTFEAEDGVAALKVLKSQTIDFIISDWNMPNMSGLELLKAVRADADFCKIPFLMITAEATKENIVLALKAGVSNYIVKPFPPAKLNEKIAQILEKQNSAI